ncbi:MAG: VIT1/CCC1 transporter family protein [Candidatus Andersenbacteria bacterium]
MAKLPAKSFLTRVQPSYVRNIVFGIEDSLVSTVGLLSGIAVGNVPTRTILLTGLVYTLVEGFSMAMGSFLSEYSAEEYTQKRVPPLKKSLKEGTIMFFSYFSTGFIPLAPYLFIDSTRHAFYVSVVLSLAAIFIMGAIFGRLSRINWFRNAVRVLIVGGISVAIGITIGRLFRL